MPWEGRVRVWMGRRAGGSQGVPSLLPHLGFPHSSIPLLHASRLPPQSWSIPLPPVSTLSVSPQSICKKKKNPLPFPQAANVAHTEHPRLWQGEKDSTLIHWGQHGQTWKNTELRSSEKTELTVAQLKEEWTTAFADAVPHTKVAVRSSSGQNISSSSSQLCQKELHSSVESEVDSDIVNGKRWNYEFLEPHSDSLQLSVKMATNQYYSQFLQLQLCKMFPRSCSWGEELTTRHRTLTDLCRARIQPCSQHGSRAQTVNK